MEAGSRTESEVRVGLRFLNSDLRGGRFQHQSYFESLKQPRVWDEGLGNYEWSQVIVGSAIVET